MDPIESSAPLTAELYSDCIASTNAAKPCPQRTPDTVITPTRVIPLGHVNNSKGGPYVKG